MSSLRELQQLCYRAFLHEESEPLAAELSALDSIPNDVRIEIYQNNARETFRKTLTRTYPVIAQLAGDECFRALAHDYMLTHPSRSGDLARFGAAFAGYLETHYGNSEFGYLPDVARLEWAIEEALLESEPNAASLEPLRTLDTERLGELVFARAPSARFVASRYPILDIWRSNQPGQDQTVDLGRGAEHVALRRTGDDVTLRRLDPATYALGVALAEGAVLERAAAAAGDALDLAAALNALVIGGYLCAPELPSA